MEEQKRSQNQDPFYRKANLTNVSIQQMAKHLLPLDAVLWHAGVAAVLVAGGRCCHTGGAQAAAVSIADISYVCDFGIFCAWNNK